MKVFKLSFFVVLIIFFVTSCVGRNFVKPDPDTLIPGVTTYDEIVDRFGPPQVKGTDIINDVKLRFLGFTYASTPSKSRRMTFLFQENLLVGYEFSSLYQNDSTSFDQSKISEIKKGVTTKEGVIKIFGNNYGKHIYPLISDKTQSALVYTSTKSNSTFTGAIFYKKKLVITIDHQNVVTDVKFVEIQAET